MRPVIQVISLFGILGLSLMSLTGCGEKRIHVATVSGAPGEEMNSASTTNPSAGIAGNSVEESSLTGQGSTPEAMSPESIQPVAPVEPLNFAHEPSSPAPTDDSFMRDDISRPSTEAPADMNAPTHSQIADNSQLSTGSPSDFSTQSGSSSMNGSPQDQADGTAFPAPAAFQGDMEPIPDSFQVAKAEPSDMLRQQLDKIKEEELATASAGLEDVFFQFDSWSLTAEAKESLERDLGWLTSDPASLLVIEGHADQRGTQAYNMVLGKKRAMAIRDYLAQSGVDPSRLSVISYGKDKPFCQDATEVCYQLNRRGHLLVQN